MDVLEGNRLDYLSGFFTIIGYPNVGKSTLVNAMVGEKISIVSPKPQTTRNSIRGVLTRQGYQMVFIDTPGIHQPRNRLGEFMVRVAYEALDSVDAVIFLLDAKRGIGPGEQALAEKLSKVRAPVIACINKIDEVGRAEIAENVTRLSEFEYFVRILPVSAKTGEGLGELERELRKHLKPGPQYFPEDMITDQPERVIAAEIIREKALNLLNEEVPHGIGVEIEKMQEREDGLVSIYAVVHCEKESHKGIVIGKGGSMLKKIGTDARRDLEWILGTKVYLELHVKVRENWRNSRQSMRMMGYE